MRASGQPNLDILTFSIPEGTVPEYLFYLIFEDLFTPEKCYLRYGIELI